MKYPQFANDPPGPPTGGPTTPIRKVAPQLWIGGFDAGAPNVIAEKPQLWGAVLSVGNRDMNPPLRWEKEAGVAYHGSKYQSFFRYPIADEDGGFTEEFLNACWLAWRSYVQANREAPFLVTCDLGASRSPALAYMILRAHYELAAEEALRRVKVGIWSPRPRHLEAVEAFLFSQQLV